MSETIAGVGIIGCGVISAAYLKAARLFPQIEIRALADLDLERRRRAAPSSGHRRATVPELLADPAIDIVLNLTTPAAHVPVALQAIAAGKHVYGEKPLAVSTEEARRLLGAAERRRRARSAARPTPFSAAAIRARGACSTTARSAGRSAAPRSCCWPGMSAGIRTPTSTMRARAAGRCSTWAPITSPTSSSCSGRSARWWPSARSAGRGA